MHRLVVRLLSLQETNKVHSTFSLHKFQNFYKKLHVTDLFVNKVIQVVCTSLTTSKLLRTQFGNLVSNFCFCLMFHVFYKPGCFLSSYILFFLHFILIFTVTLISVYRKLVRLLYNVRCNPPD